MPGEVFRPYKLGESICQLRGARFIFCAISTKLKGKLPIFLLQIV